MNLLPEEEKILVQHEANRRMIIFFMMNIVAIFGIGVLILAPLYVRFFFERRESEKSLSLERDVAMAQDTELTLSAVRDAKSIIDGLKPFTASSTSISILLEDIRHIAADGITLHEIGIGQDGMVTLRGIAATRQSILDFEDRLRASMLFEDVVIPIASIVQQRDIRFSLQLKLVPEKRL